MYYNVCIFLLSQCFDFSTSFCQYFQSPFWWRPQCDSRVQQKYQKPTNKPWECQRDFLHKKNPVKVVYSLVTLMFSFKSTWIEATGIAGDAGSLEDVGWFFPKAERSFQRVAGGDFQDINEFGDFSHVTCILTMAFGCLECWNVASQKVPMTHWLDALHCLNTLVKRSPEAREVLSIQVVQPCPAHFDHPKLLQYHTVPTFVILSPSAPQSAFSSCRIEAAVANRARDLVLVRSYGSTNLWLVVNFGVDIYSTSHEVTVSTWYTYHPVSFEKVWSRSLKRDCETQIQGFCCKGHSHLPWSAHICLEVFGHFSKCKCFEKIKFRIHILCNSRHTSFGDSSLQTFCSGSRSRSRRRRKAGCGSVSKNHWSTWVWYKNWEHLDASWSQEIVACTQLLGTFSLLLSKA